MSKAQKSLEKTKSISKNCAQKYTSTIITSNFVKTDITNERRASKFLSHNRLALSVASRDLVRPALAKLKGREMSAVWRG